MEEKSLINALMRNDQRRGLVIGWQLILMNIGAIVGIFGLVINFGHHEIIKMLVEAGAVEVLTHTPDS